MRKFNADAYDTCDKQSKDALLELVKTLGYTLIGDIDKEHYKKYDLVFKRKNKYISFENEVRENFDLIKERFNTIHIPIRKKNTKATIYAVWKNNFKEVAFIMSKDMKGSKVVSINCKERYSDGNRKYTEDFLDIPKKLAKYYKLNNGKWERNII